MSTSRDYAKDLVGEWDRSQYGKLGDAAQTTQKTRWGNIQNQFANLKNQLEAQRQEAEQEYAKGVGAVSENSFDRMNQGSADLVSRGLTNSGVGSLLAQGDIRAKGQDVNKLLDNFGDVMSQNANRLQQGGTQAHQQGMNVNQELASTLETIGNRDLSSQMQYNQGLAEIAEGRDARVANNELAAMQRRASGGGGSRGGSSDEDKAALEEFYKKAAVNEVLMDPNMDRTQKAVMLRVGLGQENAAQMLSDYNKFVTRQDVLARQQEPVKPKTIPDKFKDLYNKGGIVGNNSFENFFKKVENHSSNVGVDPQLLLEKDTAYMNSIKDADIKRIKDTFSSENLEKIMKHLKGLPVDSLPNSNTNITDFTRNQNNAQVVEQQRIKDFLDKILSK
jgi:hypothetical protein